MDHGIAYDPSINFGQVATIIVNVLTILGLVVAAAVAWGSLKNRVENLGQNVTSLKDDTAKKLDAIQDEISELRKTTVELARVSTTLESHADLIGSIQKEVGELRREVYFPLKPPVRSRTEQG